MKRLMATLLLAAALPAVALPAAANVPLPAPVTMATLPSILNRSSIRSVSLGGRAGGR